MKLGLAAATLLLVLFCVLSTTDAHISGLERLEEVARVRREIDHELKELAPRVRRQATEPGTGGTTDPSTGNALTRFFKSILRAFLYPGRLFLSASINALQSLGKSLYGVCYGIADLLNKMNTWIAGI